MTSLNDNMTILVCSCDGYSDLWDPFFRLLSHYWKNIQCEVILNTESKSYSCENISVKCLQLYNAPNVVSYGQRIIDHLNRVKTPYTMILLDDYFIRRTIDEKRLETIIRWMDENPGIACMSFDSTTASIEDNKYPGFNKMKKYSMYKLNMQAGIWRTDKLLKYWQPDDDPWTWEVFANYSTFDKEDLFYAISDREESPVYYGYCPEGMGVFRGKWVINDVQPLFENHGYNIDYSNRGIYIKDQERKIFPNIYKTLFYMCKRMKFKYFIGFACFEILKRLKRLLKRELLFQNYPAYLQERYEKGK